MLQTKAAPVDNLADSAIPSKGYAAHNASTPLSPWSFERRPVGAHDVLIEIRYCGVCHTDIHFVRNDLGMTVYPIVPGHEIVGVVSKTGDHVSKFKQGDIVGVGCLVESCRECNNCKNGEEQFCLGGLFYTYTEPKKKPEKIRWAAIQIK